jgi:uncharacterized protein YdeI (YjbR/CyaY-like superfamily)
MEPTFFATPADFRAWLEAHHETARELWVGFYKKGTGKPSITWPESVDEALCVGWIDGVRKSLGDDSYVIRFTPRKPRSNWSAVNVARVRELTAKGRMRPAGLRAFEQRAEEKTGIYAYENRDKARLDEAAEREFRARPEAWEFFQSRPPGYRKIATWWVVSAKKEETRRKRLATLIEESAQGRLIGLLQRPDKPK